MKMLLTTITNMDLRQWADVFTIIGLPLLLISLVFAYVQLSALKTVAQSQNTIALNTMFFNDPTNIGIIGAIEEGAPILKENEGQFLAVQLDKYLGDFETVASVYQEGLLTKEQLEHHFSDYIEKLGSNPEVKKYLDEYPSYFDGLRFLVKLLNVQTIPLLAGEAELDDAPLPQMEHTENAGPRSA
jgi:hypothetical protein